MSTFIESVCSLFSLFWTSANLLTGRTARIGNQGLATSFYNERDEPMAPFLAKILVESGNNVPDFLDEYKPADDAPLDFDDDSAAEDDVAQVEVEDTGAGDGDAWGSGQAHGSTNAADDVWGGSASGNTTGNADTNLGTTSAAAAASAGW